MTQDPYLQLLARLEATPQAAFLFGLDAMRAAVEAEGLQRPARYVVIVAGTNGKGTVASTLHAMCVGAGLKTGIFTSPHLVDYRERIRINGEAISEEALVRIASPLVDRWGATSAAEPRPLSYFEMGALLALAAFQDACCDVAILEVGLGGRLDATNVIDADLAILTSISLDHTEYLGSTLAEIACEKAAVARPGRVAFVHDAHGGVQELREALTEIGAEVRVVESSSTAPAVTNGALASSGFAWIADAMGFDPEPGLRWGVANVRWPGRQEQCSVEGRTLTIDGAHNPESVAALERWLRSLALAPQPAIVSLSGGRSVRESLWPVREFVTRWVVCAPDFARARPAHEVAAELRALEANEAHPRPVDLYPSVAQAYDATRDLGDALVFGSLYLVGEVYLSMGFGRAQVPSILKTKR